MSIPVADHGVRRSALAAALAERGIDAWIAYGDDRQFAGADHVRYLSRLQPHFEGALVVGAPGSTNILSGPETVGYAELVTDGAGIDRVLPIAELAHPGLAYRSIALTDGAAHLAAALAGVRRVGLLGGDRIAAPLAAALLEPLRTSGIELVDADDVAYALRARKTAHEQALIDEAFAIAALGMQAAAAAIAPGRTESDVAAAAEARMREAGAEGFGIDAMVGAGPLHSRTILARSTRREIERGDSVAVTLCPRHEGYHACLARAFSVGPSPEVERHAAAARAAQRAGLDALSVGRPGRSAVRACDEVLSELVPEARIRDVWIHNTGMVEFEPPVFTAASDALLETDMAFNIDVPIFDAPWGGMRLEDGFAVEDGRIRPRLADAEGLVPTAL
jgi:Xaa-Pro aminopeptidase